VQLTLLLQQGAAAGDHHPFHRFRFHFSLSRRFRLGTGGRRLGRLQLLELVEQEALNEQQN
jgi:hypothetical protein